MEVTDFLPKYPNINKSQYDVLNPYSQDFYQALYHKKEFYENRLDNVELFPQERGLLTKHQNTIVRYLSSHTPYDRVILIHAMGLGKTCSAIGAIEQIMTEKSTFTGALILAKGDPMLDNFLKELVEKCTSGQYIPEDYRKLNELEKIFRIKKKVKFYQFLTFAKFAKKIKNMSDLDIINEYSNKIIVIDEVHNLRIQKEKRKETLETYQQYHRFLHLIKNCKILLLSGTPMKDTPDEIASVSNLILPLEDQLPSGDEFLHEYMNKDENVYTLKPEKIPELKLKLKGMVSFLREAHSTVNKEFMGQPHFATLRHFIVFPLHMSPFQNEIYTHAYNMDKSGKKGVYTNMREASLFVYPNGTYGSEGFNKYIKVSKTKSYMGGTKKRVITSYKFDPEFKTYFTDKNLLESINKYSVTYSKVISIIIETHGNCFIYSSVVKGSGAILFSLLLELFGYSKATGRETEPGLRYGILTNITSSTTDIRRIIARFNRPDNKDGKYIKVIIGSKAVSEGFSFNNVIFEAINTPHWNYSETSQAIARGIRIGSHKDLHNPVVRVIQPVAMPSTEDIMSIDLFMYKTSEDKDISIRNILRVLMESAFDCGLNYLRNYVKGVDGSRECDYTVCDYQCDGIDMNLVKNGLEETDIDYSTYQMYYIDPQSSIIRKKIEQLFRVNANLDLQSIINNLKNEFTEEDIKSALFVIQEASHGEEFEYKTFLSVYSRTTVKKIMNGIDRLFRIYFHIDLMYIYDTFSKYTDFEVLTALHTFINENIVIKNKYGFTSYLREHNNVFFLVPALIDSTDYYYAQYPNASVNRHFDDVMDMVYTITLPHVIKKLSSTQDDKEFNTLMQSLPTQVREMFIENSIDADIKNIEYNNSFRKHILEYFKGYIRHINNVWVSTFLQNEGILRCRQNDIWKECEKRYSHILIEHEEERMMEIRRKNPYGMMGKYNPENNAFCIVEFKQKESLDKRKKHTGKVCDVGGWKINDLVDIAINRLKMDPPPGFLKDYNREKLLEKIRLNPDLEGSLKYTEDNDLRRAIYWGLNKKQGGNRGIKNICVALKDWFKKHGLLEIDHQCGVQGKKKGITISEPKKFPFRIETMVPINEREKIKTYGKDISKIMSECFVQEKYNLSTDDNLWVLVFFRKLVGFIVIDGDNIILNVCAAKKYNRKGISIEAIRKATQYICTARGVNPTLVVNNRDINFDKRINMYQNLGYNIEKTDNRYTYMKNNCK